MDNPLVSIVMVTFNRSNWLPMSIQGVLDQTYQNWELIVWNDGSTDDTETYLLNMFDDRIKVFHDSNHGKSYGFNQSLKFANGEYVAFLDDDDIWHPDKLDSQIRALSKHPEIEIIITDYVNCDHQRGIRENGLNRYQDVVQYIKCVHLEGNLFLFSDGLIDALSHANFIAYSSIVINKEVLIRLSGFNEELKSAIDSEFWWRIALSKYKCGLLKQELLVRNWLPESLCRPSINHFENRMLCCDICYRATENKPEYAHARLLLKKQKKYFFHRILREYALMGDSHQAVALLFSSSYICSFRSIYLTVGSLLPTGFKNFLLNLKKLTSEPRV